MSFTNTHTHKHTISCHPCNNCYSLCLSLQPETLNESLLLLPSTSPQTHPTHPDIRCPCTCRYYYVVYVFFGSVSRNTPIKVGTDLQLYTLQSRWAQIYNCTHSNQGGHRFTTVHTPIKVGTDLQLYTLQSRWAQIYNCTHSNQGGHRFTTVHTPIKVGTDLQLYTLQSRWAQIYNCTHSNQGGHRFTTVHTPINHHVRNAVLVFDLLHPAISSYYELVKYCFPRTIPSQIHLQIVHFK